MADSLPSKVSDVRILELNEQIQGALLSYVDIAEGQIRFDMPDKDHPPDAPTICVFLYDIQEDMKLRHSLPGITRSAAPRYVAVKCCYLLTYWDPLKETVVGPRSQTMKVMNQMLNALLNLETVLLSKTEEGEDPSVLTRVIEPSEQLAGLGNLWQSFGDKPRLCLNLAVTVPVKLTQVEDTAPAVSHLQLDTQLGAVDDSSAHAVIRAFNVELIKQVVPKTALERAQLEKLQVTVSPDTSKAANNVNQLIIKIVGTLSPSLYKRLNSSNIKVYAENLSAGVKLSLNVDGLKASESEVIEK
ncbi:hypothetical protein ACVWZP_001076 [Pseudomonas sp. TE36184]